jgi:serine/threonine protein phosphatase PrpC
MRIRFAGETDIGKTHDHNEDSLYLPDNVPIGVVADGMGGHASGEVASKMAIEAMDEYFHRTTSGWNPIWPMQMDPLRFNIFRMESAIALANARIHARSKIDPACKNMGTTVVAIYFEDNYCILAHVGDSRVYRWREEGMELMMEDHSYLNDLARLRHISVQEALESGTKINIVTRVIGPNPQVFVDTTVIYPKIGDIFILCSDGLNDMISDEEIYDITKSTKDLDEICEKLVKAANDKGGEDNITALAARVEPE